MIRRGTWGEAVYTQDHTSDTWVDVGPERAVLPGELSIIQRTGSIRGVRLG